MKWYLEVWKKYADFRGRARRKEYWLFHLFNVVFLMILLSADASLGWQWDDENRVGVLSGLYSVAVLLPSVAVLVRRLHDTGRSAWWLLIVNVPLLGSFVLLLFLLQDSEPGENRYGPNPKETEFSWPGAAIQDN